MTAIPICYCGNRRIFGGIFMSVLSILKNTDAPLDIILLTMDVSEKNEAFLPFSEEQQKLLDKTLKAKNPESTARIIDVGELYRKYLEKGKNNHNAYTPYASIRLFLDLLDVPEKLLYLDADIMCLSDVSEYYGIDIGEYEFAATLDVVGRKFFRNNYCNSGVMLLNMKKIREFAILCGTSSKTLRFYDSIGLLEAEYTDPANGYRYYSDEQKEQYETITTFKQIGFTLDEIKREILGKDDECVLELLREKLQELSEAEILCRRQIRSYEKAIRRRSAPEPGKFGVWLIREEGKVIVGDGVTTRVFVCSEQSLDTCADVMEGLFGTKYFCGLSADELEETVENILPLYEQVQQELNQQ